MSFTWGKEDYCATCVTHKWSGIDIWSSRNLCGIQGTQNIFLSNGKNQVVIECCQCQPIFDISI